MKTWLRRAGGALLFVVVAYAAVLIFPSPLFAHHLRYKAFDLYSDRPIPSEAAAVLDDAQRRLGRSEIYDPVGRYSVFVCNDNWRLALFSQRFSGSMGGAADTVVSVNNVFLREADIAANRLIPASRWRATMADRPLSYYVAHEATHILEARAFGRALGARYPRWLVEGYADYVGKAGQFDVAENRRALLAGAREMDPGRSGLYRRYHLEVLYLLERKHIPLAMLFAHPPSEASVLRAIAADETFRQPSVPAHPPKDA